MLNKILGDGISSRLFRCIREARGLAYDIGSEYHAYRDGGLLVVEGSTHPHSFEAVLNHTLSAIAGLFSGNDPVQPEELLRAKNQIKAQHLLAAEDTHTRMGRLGTQEYYFGRNISTAEIIAQIDAVDVGQLETIHRQCLAEGLSKVAVAIVGPETTGNYEVIANEALQANTQPFI